MNREIYTENIQCADRTIPCDLVIKNVTVIDVFQGSSFIADVGIANGYIIGTGRYNGTTQIDGSGKYICPSLIDAHAHIESSFLTPNEYYKIALLHGITSVIADPHEIANVIGVTGINLMLNLSRNIPFDYYYMLPSCVPSTAFEDSGAAIKNQDLENFYSNDKVLGLAEIMDYPAVSNLAPDMVNKLFTAVDRNCVIDGHGAGLNTRQLNTLSAAYIKTDHECHSAEEVLERVRRGMYVLLREGTAAKNLIDLLPAITPANSRRLCLCTDDKHIDEIIENGSIDGSIRLGIQSGISPETAIQMATLNAAECYNLKNKGAIAPGYIADFIILNSLEDFSIEYVYKNGKQVVHNNKLVNITPPPSYFFSYKPSINIPMITEKTFEIPLLGKRFLNVIELIPNKLETKLFKCPISSIPCTDYFYSLTKEDLLKIAVIERHKNTGNIGLGIIKGLQIKYGAIATTISHDSHNLVVTGTNDRDMIIACKEIQKIGGGIVVVQNGEILSSLRLEVAGLMTALPVKKVYSNLISLNKAIDKIAPGLSFNPTLALSFLSLPVIPELKITDRGLFSVRDLSFITLTE